MSSGEMLLDVRGLRTYLYLASEVIRAVDGVTMQLIAGQTAGIVGESGSGKSMTAQSIIRLLPDRGKIVDGSVLLNGENLVGVSERKMRHIRGRQIAMVFQDPMTALNPTRKISSQIVEALQLHENMDTRTAHKRTLELLGEVGIADPRRTADSYPHHLSGGMRQRVCIAMALSCDPQILIADEPTTALDVRVQAQVIELLKTLQLRRKLGLIFITHDLGVVAQLADEVYVMYAGQVVEQAPTRELLAGPEHPYTEALLAAVPRLNAQNERLRTIPGQPPDLGSAWRGCRFADRCSFADLGDGCSTTDLSLRELRPGHWVRSAHPRSERSARNITVKETISD